MKDSKGSGHNRVIENYFQTTSSAGSARDKTSFEFSIAGIRRRLGSWLDVDGKDVLDLGSGTGELCRVVSDAGANSVVGVNLSREEIEFARRQVDANFVFEDVVSYLGKCEASSIDCIFALNILEHLDKDSLVILLERAVRALKPGGVLIAMVPNATSPFGGMTRYWDITHHNAFTPSSVRQLALLVGFSEDVRFRECGPVPYGAISFIRYGLWQVIRLLIRGYLIVELASAKGGVYTADMMFRLRKPEK